MVLATLVVRTGAFNVIPFVRQRSTVARGSVVASFLYLAGESRVSLFAR